MSEPIRDETGDVPMRQEPPSPFRHRGRRQRQVAEPTSPMRRPSTVLLHASPTNIAGVLARNGLLVKTLSWGGSPSSGPAEPAAPEAERPTEQ